MNIEDSKKRVNIVTLNQDQFEQCRKTSSTSIISTSSEPKAVTVSSNFANNTSITFKTSNLEQLFAQIIVTRKVKLKMNWLIHQGNKITAQFIMKE